MLANPNFFSILSLVLGSLLDSRIRAHSCHMPKPRQCLRQQCHRLTQSLLLVVHILFNIIAFGIFRPCIFQSFAFPTRISQDYNLFLLFSCHVGILPCYLVLLFFDLTININKSTVSIIRFRSCRRSLCLHLLISIFSWAFSICSFRKFNVNFVIGHVIQCFCIL